ncbi:hypothetical protein CDL60_18560 [Roseateles noduli]|nr:hypothetical protein CDL60_18560 [Roseateles noduli]
MSTHTPAISDQRLSEAFEFNRAWFKTHAQRSKRMHFALQGLTVILPLATMLVELNLHCVSLNLTLLFAVSLLASLNLTLAPVRAWQRFKCAEIDVGAQQTLFHADLEAARGNAIEELRVIKEHVVLLRAILLRHADEHFKELEDSLKERPEA